MSEKSVLVFGDSVTWGQGHVDENKFSHLVAKHLGLTVRMHAHSGATIGVGDTQTGRCGPEAPNHYPTILQQLAASTDDPSNTDLIVLDGGINDIGVETILHPLTSEAYLRNVTRRYCHDDMVHLLQKVLATFTSEATRVVVTSYFPIFSRESNFDLVLRYLAARSIAPAPTVEATDRRAFVLRSVKLALLFWRESRAQLGRAVATVGSDRVRFADVPFQEENAMFAPAPWLFNVRFEGGRLVPEDDVIAERHQQCVLCHLRDPFHVAACDIASAGHPNLPGAQQFADAILAASS